MHRYGRRQWHPTPVLLRGKSHGWRSLVGCSPWGHSESDRTERLHFHFSLSCTGEGNGNPLQCSCLENPRDREAWWAAVYGVAQSQTRLKRLSSSTSSIDTDGGAWWAAIYGVAQSQTRLKRLSSSSIDTVYYLYTVWRRTNLVLPLMCQKLFKHVPTSNLIVTILSRYYFPLFSQTWVGLGNFFKVKNILSSIS